MSMCEQPIDFSVCLMKKLRIKSFIRMLLKGISNNFKMRTDTLTGTLVETKRLPWQPFLFYVRSSRTNLAAEADWINKSALNDVG